MALPEKNVQSRVGERVEFLQGKKVRLRVAYAEIGQLGGETFDAIFRDCIPLGREYFFVLEVSNATRMIRTSAVIEICEIV
jgi:hypothetical protein